MSKKGDKYDFIIFADGSVTPHNEWIGVCGAAARVFCMQNGKTRDVTDSFMSKGGDNQTAELYAIYLGLLEMARWSKAREQKYIDLKEIKDKTKKQKEQYKRLKETYGGENVNVLVISDCEYSTWMLREGMLPYVSGIGLKNKWVKKSRRYCDKVNGQEFMKSVYKINSKNQRLQIDYLWVKSHMKDTEKCRIDLYEMVKKQQVISIGDDILRKIIFMNNYVDHLSRECYQEHYLLKIKK